MVPKVSHSPAGQSSSRVLGLLGAGRHVAFLLSCRQLRVINRRSKSSPSLTSEHRCTTSTCHVKYFHGGKQNLRLEVSLLLDGGIVWGSLEANSGLRQRPHGHHVHSVSTGSSCLAHMLILQLLGVLAASSSQLPSSGALPSADQVASPRWQHPLPRARRQGGRVEGWVPQSASGRYLKVGLTLGCKTPLGARLWLIPFPG